MLVLYLNNGGIHFYVFFCIVWVNQKNAQSIYHSTNLRVRAICLLAFKSSFTFWKSQILFPKFKLFGKLDSILLIKPNKLFQEELILFLNGYIKQLENLKFGKKSHLHIFTPYENWFCGLLEALLACGGLMYLLDLPFVTFKNKW